jgi:type II secretory pathway pseudopilin PulG
MIARLMRRRGVTLIEAVLFISIALAVIVGGLVFYQQAAIASQTQATIRLAQALVAETRSRFRSDDERIDNLDEVMVKAGAVPGNAVLDGTDGCWVQSQWGGCIAFKSSFIKSSGERYMEMKLYGIRPAVRARIVPFDEAGNGVLGGGRTYAAVYSESSGKLVDGVNGWHSIAGGALTPAKAGALCSYADGTDDVYVVVTWRWNS